MELELSQMKYGNQNYIVEKLLIVLAVLWGMATICKVAGQEHTHRTHTLTREHKVVAITILAEARGEGNAGMYAVAAVIAQRSFERKRTPEQVCLKAYQFSCWNGKKVKDLEHLLTLPQGKYAIQLAKTVKRLSRSYVGYANHYHATWMKKKPYWAKDKRPVKVIGQHAFYKL
jgi:spore germination cell wall hydrolase CwlJ-like protein